MTESEESYESVDFGDESEDEEKDISETEIKCLQSSSKSPMLTSESTPIRTMITPRVNITQFLESPAMFTMEQEELVPFLIHIPQKMDIFTLGRKGGVTNNREIWWTVAHIIDYNQTNTVARSSLHALELSCGGAENVHYDTFKNNLTSQKSVQQLLPTPFVNVWESLSGLYFSSYMLHELLIPMALPQQEERSSKLLETASILNKSRYYPPFACNLFSDQRAYLCTILDTNTTKIGSICLFWALVNFGAMHLSVTLSTTNVHDKNQQGPAIQTATQTTHILRTMRIVLGYIISFVKGPCGILARARMKLVSSDTSPSKEVFNYVKYIYERNGAALAMSRKAASPVSSVCSEKINA